MISPYGIPHAGKSFRNFPVILLALAILLSPLRLVCQEGNPQVPAKRPLKSASERNYPPFCIVDKGGNATGFSIELMQEAMRRMGAEVAFSTGDWADVMGMLDKGEVEALPLVGRTPEREDMFDFTFPYMTLYGAILVRRDEKSISHFSDLRGRTVSVMKGDNAEEFLLRQDRGITVRSLRSFADALRELSAGHCDAVVAQRLVALKLIDELRIHNLRILDEPLADFRQDFCFAVKEGDKDTLALLNEGLAVVFADGTYRHLHSKWFARYELPSGRSIAIGGDMMFPPFEFLDGKGQPSGFNTEIFRAVAREKNLEVGFELAAWSETLESLREGRIDMIQGIFYSPSRAKDFDFSLPYLQLNYVAVARKDGPPIPSTMDEMRKLRIVVEDQDIAHEMALRHGCGKNLSTAPNMRVALLDVSLGKHDCSIVPVQTAQHIIKDSGIENLKIGSKTLFSADYCFAVRKGNKALLSEFSDGLNIIEENGEFQKIRRKWLGLSFDMPYLRVILFCIGGLAASLLLAMLWVRSLRSNVTRRVAEIKELENKYIQIFEANRDGFVIVDGQGRITDANKAYCDMLGYDLDEIRKLPDFYSITPEKWHKWEHEEIWQRRLLGFGWTGIYEKEYIRKNGTVFPVELQAGAVRGRNGTISYLWGVARDISERKKAEQDIKGRLECERIISETSSLSLTTSSLSDFMEDCVKILGEHLDISRAYVFQTRDGGVTFDNSHEWVAKNVLSVKGSLQAVPAGDFKWFFDELSTKNAMTIADVGKIPDTKERLLLQSQDVKSLTVASFHSDGRMAGFIGLDECRAPRKWLQSEEETLRSVCRIISNTIARLRAQEEEHLLSTAIENSSEIIEITDSNANIQYVNSAFEKVTGYSKAEAVGQNPRILKSGKHDGDFYKDLWQRLTSGRTWRGRFTNKRKNGTTYVEDAVISPIIGQDGTIRNFVAIKRDMTEQLDLEKQFHTAQKMESIGRLAGGVAHDFNNMLAVILGFAELATSKTNENDPVRKDIEQITKAGNRAANLTRQLLAFARREMAKPRILGICEAIRDSARMIERMIGEDIEVELSLSKDEIRVNMDPSQLDQILMNLCINARDAISGKGKISISTSKRSFDEEHCRHHPQFIPGDFAVISVADNGCGMDENVMNNIFEPFFTTKPSGKGTGLGLSTIYGIVKQNGGFITVSSTPGQGSIFDVHIPAANEKVEVPPEEKKLIQAAETVQWQNMTILVAEDEPSILTVCRSMLENSGYNMIEADSPIKALDLATRRKERIDLLLTDVVMPDMSGKELADKICQIHPECKVLYMSGYTADIISKKGIVGRNVGIIRKPFTKAELVEKVKQALADAATQRGGWIK